MKPMLTNGPLLLAIAGSVAVLILLTAKLKWHPFLALLVAAAGLGLVIGLSPAEVIATIKQGFGGLIGSVGLLIILGAIIGVCLERSGAAERIATLILGNGSRPGLRLVALGAVISIPVFCDSGFIILAGLLPALAQRSGKPLAVLALSVAGGLYLTHTLVPPTPGPLAAAANLGVGSDIGTLTLLGLLTALPVGVVTWWAAGRLGRGVPIDFPGARPAGTAPPSVAASLLPLLLPILLIALGSASRFLPLTGAWPDAFAWFTDPTVALGLGCIPALLLVRDVGSTWVGDALALGGPIVIITGIGGAFGAILKASPLADTVAGWVGSGQLSFTSVLLLGFGLAALLKSAQGSSTAALVIASGILAPLLPGAGITGATGLALVTLAIGGGAMTVSHANDSYFWVVTRFSGIPVGAAYRSYTLLTGVMGLGVLGWVLLLGFLLV